MSFRLFKNNKREGKPNDADYSFSVILPKEIADQMQATEILNRAKFVTKQAELTPTTPAPTPAPTPDPAQNADTPKAPEVTVA